MAYSMIRQKRNQFTVEGIINIRKHFVSLDSVASYFVGNPVNYFFGEGGEAGEGISSK